MDAGLLGMLAGACLGFVSFVALRLVAANLEQAGRQGERRTLHDARGMEPARILRLVAMLEIPAFAVARRSRGPGGGPNCSIRRSAISSV